jgi:hypothetical protein
MTGLLPLVSPAEYYRDDRLPSPYDDAITEALAVSRSPSEIAALHSETGSDEGWLLLTFAARMATLSVREHNRERLKSALAALALEGGRIDLRETLQVLSLIYDAALRIGQSPGPLFSEGAQMSAGDRLAEEMARFPERAEESRSIESMGFTIDGSGDRFQYRRRW